MARVLVLSSSSLILWNQPPPFPWEIYPSCYCPPYFIVFPWGWQSPDEVVFNPRVLCSNTGCLSVSGGTAPCGAACVSVFTEKQTVWLGLGDFRVSTFELHTPIPAAVLSLQSLHRLKCVDKTYICRSWLLSLQQTFLSQLTRSALVGRCALFVCPAGWLSSYYTEKSDIQTWDCSLSPTCTIRGICWEAWRHFSPMV